MPVREVALYDPNRKPASWMEVIQPTEYAVFFRDVETGAQLTCDGHLVDPAMPGSCLIFDSLEEAEQYCRRKIESTPDLQCEVFDSHGRANPPVATFVDKRHEGRLESHAQAIRKMRWGYLLLAASIPLFWYTWKTRGEGWMAAFFGIQFALAGLRFLHWGYSMKEELLSREAQSKLRKQENATRSGRS